MLADYSNVNFTVTSAVRDIPITARLHNLTVRQILDRILTDAGLIWDRDPSRNLVEVMTIEETKPRCPESRKPVLITRIFYIQYVTMEDISPILQQLKSPMGKQYYLPKHQKIVVVDTPDVLAKVETKIAELDRPGARAE
jgi:type II secretory pathway component GspD/PulD (secretin)